MVNKAIGTGIPRREGDAPMGDEHEEAINGDRRAMARMLTKIENGEVDVSRKLSALPPAGKDAWSTMAITGAPGVGKSVLVDAITVSYTHLTLPTSVTV